MIIWTKIGQAYKGDKSASMNIVQEGAALKNGRGSKFLDKEKHTSRGSKLMNLIDCI